MEALVLPCFLFTTRNLSSVEFTVDIIKVKGIPTMAGKSSVKMSFQSNLNKLGISCEGSKCTEYSKPIGYTVIVYSY